MVSSQSSIHRLKRELQSRIRSLYIEKLNHYPRQISLNIFEKQLVIVIDSAVTKPEALLISSDRSSLAYQVRTKINKILQPQLICLIENVLDSAVINLLLATHLESGVASITAIFEQPVLEGL